MRSETDFADNQVLRTFKGGATLPFSMRAFTVGGVEYGDKLHHQFAVIDNKTVITGAFNWSPSVAHTSDETLLVIHSPKLAAYFTREMDRLWDSAELGITPRIRQKLERQRAKCGRGVERG